MRLPWGPLADAATARFGPGWTYAQLSDACGSTRDAITAWKARGFVPIELGDQVAVSLGLVPDMIWAEWAEWMDAQVEAKKEKHRAANRAYERRNRDRRNADRRARYAANIDAERARQRAYDRANYKTIYPKAAAYKREIRRKNKDNSAEKRAA